MPRGGARPGAGRKRKRPYPGMPGEAGSAIQRAEQKLRDALPDLIDVAISAAKDGDRRMLVYCIDRVLGSPIRPVEVHDAARRLASERGLDPERVVNLFEIIKRRGAAS